MAGIPQRRTYVPDPATAKIDQSREDLAQALRAVPFLRGRLVKDLIILGDTLVTHGLGYTMTGYIVVKSTSAAGELPAYVSEGPDAKKQVYLTIGASGFSGDIWFF